jgi:hypothetical protein
MAHGRNIAWANMGKLAQYIKIIQEKQTHKSSSVAEWEISSSDPKMNIYPKIHQIN